MPNESLSTLLRRRSEAVARRDAATAEIEQIDSELFPRVAMMAAAMEGVTSAEARHNAALVLATRPLAAKTHWTIAAAVKGQTAQSSMIAEAVNVLVEAGKPLSTNDILIELKKRGVSVNGKVPKNNLAAHLSHYRKVFSRTPEGWSLANPEQRAIG